MEWTEFVKVLFYVKKIIVWLKKIACRIKECISFR